MRAPPAPPPRPETARLFVALWPGHRERQAIARWGARWQWPVVARVVAARDLHVTLHFLGAVPRQRIDDIGTALRAATAAGGRFETVWGHGQVWSSGVAVLAPVAVPEALVSVQRALGDALRTLGLPVEARRFRPHVTLARRAAGAALPSAPLHCRWAVDDVALVESRGSGSGGYHVLARWPLGAGGPAPGGGP